MKRAGTVLAGVAVILTVLAGCTPHRQVADLDRLVNGSSMPRFLTVRAHPDRTPYARADWSTDGCSAGPLRSTPFDFHQACWRHDFAYRNLKRIEARTGADAWNERNKWVADRRFQTDMHRRCDELNIVFRAPCGVAADTYFKAVRIPGPTASPRTVRDDPRHFRL